MSALRVSYIVVTASLLLLAIPAAAADEYASFTDLAKHETAGTDYSIAATKRGSPLAVIAIHGGYIEPGTSDLALALADEDYSLYTFQALKAKSGKRLHLTSTHFDEPQALKLVGQSKYCLSLHGAAGDEEAVYLGGRDMQFILNLAGPLREAGFSVITPTDAAYRSEIGGDDKGNICNRTMSGMGVQLELTAGLRKALDESNRPGGRQGEGKWQKFVAAVRGACKARVEQAPK